MTPPLSRLPARKRGTILTLLFLLTLLNSMDRQTVAVLKPWLKDTFQITDTGYATLVNAFTICYASAYTFSGWVVDRLGVRVALPVFAFVWSAATIGCGLVRQFGQLVALRALLGISEPGNFPAALRAITVWYGPTQRAFATSAYNFGTVFSPLIIAYLASHFGEPAAFIVPGILGAALALVWYRVYTEPTPEMAGAAGVGAVPAAMETPAFAWGELWKTRTLWGIILCRFICDPVWYFLLFWMPGYLQEARGLSLMQTGLYGWIPHLVANLGGIAASALSDRRARRGIAPLVARKQVLAAVAVLAAAAPFIPAMPGAGATIALFSLVGVVCVSWLFGLGVVVADAFPVGNVGSVWGIAGAAGAFGAVLFNQIIGYAISTVGTDTIFLAMGFLHPLGALVLWKMIRVERPAQP